MASSPAKIARPGEDLPQALKTPLTRSLPGVS